jgi:hypothetical protein
MFENQRFQGFRPPLFASMGLAFLVMTLRGALVFWYQVILHTYVCVCGNTNACGQVMCVVSYIIVVMRQSTSMSIFLCYLQHTCVLCVSSVHAQHAHAHFLEKQANAHIYVQ